MKLEKILAETDKSGIKNLDNVVVSNIFSLVETEFSQLIKVEFVDASSQLDVLTDIIIKDGNCIMKRDRFSRLYESELKSLNKKIKELQKELGNLKFRKVGKGITGYIRHVFIQLFIMTLKKTEIPKSPTMNCQYY